MFFSFNNKNDKENNDKETNPTSEEELFLESEAFSASNNDNEKSSSVQWKLPQTDSNKKTKGPPFSTSLVSNLDYIQNHYKDCCDLVTKKFVINGTDITCAILYFEADADVTPIQEALLMNTMTLYDNKEPIQSVEQMKQRLIPLTDVKDITDLQTVHQCLLSGNVLMFINGSSIPLFINSKNVLGRAVSTPTMENVVFGAKEAFVENIRINTVLIRQRLRNEQLKIEEFSVGTDNITTVRLFYLNNKADTKVLDNVKKRIRQLQPTVIANVTSFMNALIDKPFLNVHLFYKSEKPDVIANKLNEGKFVILVDGFPMAGVAPVTFFEQFNDIEDYSNNTFYSSFIRLLRYFCFFISLLTAPIYVALTTFHPEMIPTALYINFAAQSSEVPFPTIVELVFVLITFEIIRESSIRLPSYITGTVSIVGALAIGQGVVLAGLVTTNSIIVVAFTALSSFVFPSYAISYPLRVARYTFLFFSTLYGFFGIFLVLALIVAHLSVVTSFGVPYFAGFAPFYKKALTDTFLKAPVKYLKPKLPYQENKQGGKHKND